jgi:dipeptidyl aminopeptidase/acylaminoacyl peptidase
MRAAIAFAAVVSLWTVPAGAEPVGEFAQHGDVGEVATRGTATLAEGTYRLTASGANIWGSEDAFHYAWTQRSGDLHIAADVAFEGTGGDPHRKAGLMIRQNLTPGSPYADVMVHGDGMVSLQYREVQDGPTRQIVSAVTHPRRVRLEREGDFVYFSVAGEDGVLRHAGGSFRIALQAPYLVGLALSAHDNAKVEAARFANVALTVPQLAYVPDTGYAARVESTLEVLTISNRDRRIVRQFDGKIEAPNWSRDGTSLIYNSGGKIWRIPVGGGEPAPIDTGRFVDNNNDHGLSPDGRLLAISDQIEPDNLSRIHVVTLDGSAPVRTLVDDPQARSYWHGWSPDGATLAYVRVGAGDGSYDIWAKDLAGGAPRPLIVGPGVDDGPEYSPDGKYLYFNSTRSGAMALWRANADGSEPVMLTDDPARRDWFAHLSPDGTRIAYVSFGDDVALEDHPPNRTDVQLRIVPADGSAPPEALTRLFGGQGTINVPSWSPDGRQIAFVSYRLVR